MLTANPDMIVDVPLSQIQADFAWNSRSGKWTVDSGDEEAADFSDFVRSFEGPDSTIRQDTPVELRLTGNVEKPYFLVKGYRRFKAIEVLSAKLGITIPTIRATISELTPVEARYNNLSENVTRQNLSAPDFAWGVWQLKLDAKKDGVELHGFEIAKRLGRSQGHVDKMLHIMSKAKSNITRRWRETPKAVGIDAMYAISKLPKEEQEKAFGDLLSDLALKDDGSVKRKNGWLEVAKTRAKHIGSLLGRLEQMGLIDTSNLDFGEHLDLLVPIKSTATPKIRVMIAKQINQAYLNAKQHEPKDENEESD